MVFWFGAIEICPTIKEYARILGVQHDIDFIVSPLLNTSFKLPMSTTLGIKKSIQGKDAGWLNTKAAPWLFYMTYSRGLMLMGKTRLLSSHVRMSGIKIVP